MFSTCHNEYHQPVLLRSWQPHGTDRDHAGQPWPLHESLHNPDDHDCSNLKVDSHNGEDKVEHRAEEGATAKDPLAAKTLCEVTPKELGDRVADGEPAEDQALLLGVPLELAVAVVTTVTL